VEAHVPVFSVGSIPVGMRLSDGSNHDVMVQRVSHGRVGVIAFGPDRLNAERVTALKSLQAPLLKRRAIYERFINAGLQWSGLWPHPNIIGVYGVTAVGEPERSQRPFVAMEYAAHGSLRDWLNRGGLTREAALAWAQCVAAGLTYLHEPDPAYLRKIPVTHGDLKPEHVLIQTNGVAVLTDLGLAKAVAESARMDDLLPFIEVTAAQTETQGLPTTAGVTLGTPAYMAPEHWGDGATTDPAADIYAFGIMLYELLVGRHPLLELERRHSHQAWRQAHETQLPQPLRAIDPSLPEALETLALACLAKEAHARPSARAVWERLQGVARSLGALVWEVEEIVPHTPYNELVYWSNWSASYAWFERWEEALERNDRALQIDPQAVPALSNQGDIFVGLNRYDEAKAAYQTALQYAETEKEQSMVWGRLGTMHNEAGHDALLARNYPAASARFEQADAAYARQMKLAPHESDGPLNRAVNQRLWAEAEEGCGWVAATLEHLKLALTYASVAAQLGDTTALEYERTIIGYIQQLSESLRGGEDLLAL